MVVYDLTLAGYRSDTDETDHLVKWCKAPSLLAMQLFVDSLGLKPGYTITEMVGRSDLEFEDGLDVEIDYMGVVQQLSPDIALPSNWAEL